MVPKCLLLLASYIYIGSHADPVSNRLEDVPNRDNELEDSKTNLKKEKGVQ